MRLTCGSSMLGDAVAPHDHNVVRRLRAAGCVVVGTTTMPEFGILPVTETRRFGPTHNPWDRTRTPGGSSGGSAAAVAAGMVPFAHGNDGGGSLRIPAACCGLVGLKPQRGRVSVAPDAGEAFLVSDGVLTRTVAETALLLDVLAGTEVGDSSWAPPPAEPFAQAAARTPARLRIAATTVPPLADGPVSADAIDAVARAGALLEDLGHEVVQADPPWGGEDLLPTFTALFGPAVCVQIAAVAAARGRSPRQEDMESLSWAIWQRSTSIDAVQAATAALRLQRLARSIVRWASDYDALLCPSLAEAPVPLGTLDPMTSDPMRTFARSGTFTPFTAISNVTGSPAISLPLYEDPHGLPLGVQLVGRPAGEGDLLALAAQLEEALPWAQRRPVL
jgi:amidase